MEIQLNRRKHIRLKNYDYALPGLYYVTICTFERICLFGNIVNGEMQLNNYGQIVHDEWLKTEKLRPNVKLDEFVVMPNHIHGIIVINSNSHVGATRRVAPTLGNRINGPTSGSIGAIIGQFKSTVTKRINKLHTMPNGHIWQRNYYEHIIRNDWDWHRIKRYIGNNIQNWENDKNHVLGEIL